VTRATALLFTVALFCGCDVRSATPLQDTSSDAAGRPHASATEVLYVLGGYATDKLWVYSLPSGQAEKNVLMPGYGGGYNMCSDATGDVFVPADDVIFEYAPGGKKPIAELIDNLKPESCASDPVTGDLAIVDEAQNKKCTLSFYRAPKNHSRVIYDKQGFAFCRYPSYDDSGNLFLAGSTGSESKLVELPAGSNKFVEITLNKPIADSGFMQWDGKDIALENDSGGSPDQRIIVDRISVAGSKGTIISKISFKYWPRVYAPFWIGGGQIIAPESAGDTIGIWDYPRGGPPRTTFDITRPAYTLTVSTVP
jgi:hypothetical protein